MPFLSIIIPAYEEAERLPETLALIRDYLERVDFEAEVIVVDDGSNDATVKVVRDYMRRFTQLRVIENDKNKGKGGVVRQGMLEATGEWRLFMDADYSTPVTELEKFLPFLTKYDVIIGSRYLEEGSIKVKQPWKRRMISRGGNMLIQYSLLPGIIDTQCGFKLFSAKAAEAIFSRQTMNGWAFDVEILTIARQLNFRIKEIAVDWYDAKRSKLRATKAVWNSLRDVRKIRRRVKAGAYHSEPGITPAESGSSSQ